MRIVKEAEQRRNEILDAADFLFGQKGFDGTSTNDILERVGIARGTLYYHFKSKEDIMDALIDRYSHRLLEAAREMASQKEVPVNERIIRTILALNMGSSMGGRELTRQIHQPQNALMHQKMRQAVINGVTPILSGIIEEGISQGSYRTPFPYECMEMVVIYASTVFDDGVVPLTEDGRVRRIQAIIFCLERMLGAEPNSLAYLVQAFEEKDGSVREQESEGAPCISG